MFCLKSAQMKALFLVEVGPASCWLQRNTRTDGLRALHCIKRSDTFINELTDVKILYYVWWAVNWAWCSWPLWSPDFTFWDFIYLEAAAGECRNNKCFVIEKDIFQHNRSQRSLISKNNQRFWRKSGVSSDAAYPTLVFLSLSYG